MENIIESSPFSTTTTTTSTTTTRRLRSLHLPSTSSVRATDLGRRFNSLRRPNNTAADTPTPPLPLPANVGRKNAHIKLVPNVGLTSRCFVFDVIDRELEGGGPALKLGRYSDRTVVSDRLSFKSKVVSRYHAEIWLSEQDGKIYIKDTGSSSGTFVNHIRLSAANTERTAHQEIVDGDLIQLGVDYKGGLEPMYRAVRIRLEVDRREWKETTPNPYNLAAFQQLKNQITNSTTSTDEIQECCICLYCIAPFQALFIAPCSHIYHYRCLRPLLMQNYPGFSCPLCRTYSNLEASVAVEENEVLQMLGLSNNNTNPTSEEEDDNSPLGIHQRDKTVSDEDLQETSILSHVIRPSSFLQHQISSSDGRLSTTIVGSPPRQFDVEIMGETEDNTPASID